LVGPGSDMGLYVNFAVCCNCPELMVEHKRNFMPKRCCRRAKGEFELAILDFDKALELDPDLALAHTNRGLTLLLQGRDVDAENDFAHCVRLAPGLRRTLEQLTGHTRETR
jgi:tetratricopeptide (TPR) repeat protein